MVLALLQGINFMKFEGLVSSKDGIHVILLHFLSC